MALLYRKENVLSVATDLDIQPDSGFTVTVYRPGSVVLGVNTFGLECHIELADGHGFVTNDRFITSVDPSSYNYATSVSGNVLIANNVFNPPSVGDVLVNLGADTGGSTPNYDGSDTAVYQLGSTANPITHSRITTNSDGFYEYYHDGNNNLWELVRNTTGTPIATVIGAYQIPVAVPSIINVLNYGAIGDGATDDTDAFQLAINTVNTLGTVYIPPGTYYISRGLTVTGAKVTCQGAGRGATIIYFNPAANATLFTFASPASTTILYQPTVRDLTLLGGGGLNKIAFDFVNCSGALVENVSCTGWDGAGASKFIVSEGREQLMVMGCIATGCNTVIHIKKNPDTSHGLLDCDLFNFHNCVFGNASTSTGQIILVDDGVYISNLSFTGMNSWSGGKYGFYWLDTTAPTFAINIVFNNVRWEQGTDTSGYGWYISHSLSASSVAINNCQVSAGNYSNGIYARNVDYLTLLNFRFDSNTGAGRVMYDIDTTCANVINLNPINLNGFGTETVTCTTYLKILGNIATGFGLSGSDSDTFTMDTGNRRGFYWYTKAATQTGLVAYNASNSAGAAAFVKAYNGTQTLAMTVFPASYGSSPYSGNAMLAADGTQKLYLGYAGARVAVVDSPGIGINKDSASVALDVVGSAQVTGTIGYATGAGGTVTQATNKATGVTLSKSCGQITMNNAALGAATIVSFVLTNTLIAATDVLILNHVSGGTVGSYTLNAQCAAGTATINVRNNTAGSLSEAVVIAFAIVKAVVA